MYQYFFARTHAFRFIIYFIIIIIIFFFHFHYLFHFFLSSSTIRSNFVRHNTFFVTSYYSFRVCFIFLFFYIFFVCFVFVLFVWSLVVSRLIPYDRVILQLTISVIGIGPFPPRQLNGHRRECVQEKRKDARRIGHQVK